VFEIPKRLSGLRDVVRKLLSCFESKELKKLPSFENSFFI